MGLLNPGDVHEDMETPNERQYLTVSIGTEFFRELINDMGCATRDLPCFLIHRFEYDGRIKGILEALRGEVDSQQIGQCIIVDNLVAELAVCLLRRFGGAEFSTEKVQPRHAVAAWRLRGALEYLGSHWTEKFSLDRVAEASGLSKYYLDRLFKLATGVSPLSYVIALRLDGAKHLLATSTRPITEIALELGFSDQSHFTNVFKRFTGVTPAAYRLSATK
jgi:AraC family transcriptional regulator